MKKITMSVLLFFIAITDVMSSEVKMPISGISVDIPDGYDVYELDIDKPFHKSDLIADDNQRLVVTFMQLSSGLQVNKDLVAGLRDAMVKGGFEISQLRIDVPKKGEVIALKAVLGNDMRVYIPYPNQQMIILAQFNPEELELMADFKQILASMK